MNELTAYYNGHYLPFSQVQLSPYDAGFVQGTSVAEQLRTFGGQLFRLDEHLTRLFRSLEIVDIRPGLSRDQWHDIAERIVGDNREKIPFGDDLGVSIVVTPGPYTPWSGSSHGEPTVCVSAQPLAFDQFAERYTTGQRLVIVPVRQVPTACWPPELKCRSRMHYYLADLAARRIDPTARALLLDLDGHVCEASTANVVAYFAHQGLVSPPRESILPGISVAVLEELANREQLTFKYRALRPEELARADEILLTSTSPCILPVVLLDGHAVGNGRPGPCFEQLIAAWSSDVGVDIRAQAERFARR